MANTERENYVSTGLTYFAKQNAAPKVGAYMQDYEGDLTVYWRGTVGRDVVCRLVQGAENALAVMGEKVEGSINAFGPDDTAERSFGPFYTDISKFLASTSEIPDFDACRAELTGSKGKIIVWANVSGKESANLEDGGENIGLSISQELFNGPGRPVIVNAIAETMGLGEPVATQLLDDISLAISKKGLTVGD